MSSPVECLKTQEKIGRIVKILDDPESHNGFPVVDDYDPDSVSIKMMSLQTLQYFWLRVQLLTLCIESALWTMPSCAMTR